MWLCCVAPYTASAWSLGPMRSSILPKRLSRSLSEALVSVEVVVSSLASKIIYKRFDVLGKCSRNEETGDRSHNNASSRSGLALRTARK